MKLLNLDPADRIGCSVTFNVNRFEVYHRDGWMMTAASDKSDLTKQLMQNQITDAKFDNIASSKYLSR